MRGSAAAARAPGPAALTMTAASLTEAAATCDLPRPVARASWSTMQAVEGAPAWSGHLYIRCARGHEGGGRRGSSSRVNGIRASSGGAWGAPVPAVQPVDFHRVIQEAPYGAPYVGSVATPANAAERTITAARQNRMRLSMQTDEL